MTFGTGKIWMDGKFYDWDDAKVHIGVHALHYGSSLFEGIRCYKNKSGSAIYRVKEHLKRLYDSAKIYRMNIPYTPDEFCEIIKETVRVNKLEACYIRPLVYRGYKSLGVNPIDVPVCCAVMVWSWGKYLGEDGHEKGVSVCVSSWNRPAPNTYPSLAKAGGNYLNSQLIKTEAIMNGYHEGIALDAYGYLSEGSGENIFIIRNGVIYTPPSSNSILPGITRHSVFQMARELDIRIHQHQIPRETLYISDEVFFSGTAAEITPITEIDKIKIKDGKRGPITKQLQDMFFGIIEGSLEDKFKWLTYI